MLPSEIGAGEESRTLDLNLGKVALYQLSYSRMTAPYHSAIFRLETPRSCVSVFD